MKSGIDYIFKLYFTGVNFHPLEVQKKKKTAWMELLAFEETGSESFGELKKKREQQRKLIDATLQADLDCLWISLSPQMYYGVHAKNPEKKDIFERSVVRFCHELQKEAHLRGQGFPKILVGFEIVNNLHTLAPRNLKLRKPPF